MSTKNSNNDVLKDARQVTERLLALRDDSQREILMRFFKTGPGEYGEGDEFLGIKVPVTRSVVKIVDKHLPLVETEQLLLSPWHEVRLCALLILVGQFCRFANRNSQEAMEERDAIVNFYLCHAGQINNWDLVDASAPKIIGQWLMCPTNLGQQRNIVDALAHSSHLWRHGHALCGHLTHLGLLQRAAGQHRGERQEDQLRPIVEKTEATGGVEPGHQRGPPHAAHAGAKTGGDGHARTLHGTGDSHGAALPAAQLLSGKLQHRGSLDRPHLPLRLSGMGR